ncbi:MAG: hypothetical protein Q4G21_09785 [Dermabacter sp.]|nr:hypothetical protein [Dermabacter sp.]
MTYVSAALSLAVMALVTGLSPTLYAMTVRTLIAQPRTGARLIAIMCVGLMLGASLLGIVVRFFDPDTLIALFKLDAHRLLVRRSVDLVAGTLFAVSGLVLWRRVRLGIPSRRSRRRAASGAGAEGQHGDHAASGHGSGREMLVFGFGNALVGLSNIAAMYAVGRLLSHASHNLLVQGALYVVFLVVLVAPFMTLAWMLTRFSELRAVGTRAARWLEARDERAIIAGILVVAGLVFLLLGLFGL